MKNIVNIIIAVVIFLTACSDPYADQNFKDMDSMPIAYFIDSSENAEVFSLWVDLLRHTELYTTMNLDKSYTCFIPHNDAMTDFLEEKNATSVEEYVQRHKAEAVNLVKYHTIAGKVYTTSDFPDGMFPDSTASGDYLNLEIRAGGFRETYINSEARIDSLNLEVTNGVIHVLEKVLTPVTGTIMDKLTDDFKIMRDGFERIGISEYLNLVYINGKKNRLTLFAVPDYIFAQEGEGITNLDGLVDHLNTVAGNNESEANLVNYLMYHLIDASMSTADLIDGIDQYSSKNIAVLAPNQLINCSIQGDQSIFYLNYDEETETGIEIVERNLNCKNGVFHIVNGLLEVKTPPATKVQWDLTNYSVLAQLCPDFQKSNLTSSSTHIFNDEDLVSCYRTSRGNGSFRYYVASKNDSQNYKAQNKDYLILLLGTYGWIEMASPTIIAGRYNVYVEHLNLAASQALGKLSLLIDGEVVGRQFTTIGHDKTNSTYMKGEKIGEVEFMETTTHVARIVAGDSYISYLDCITFEPIK